MSTTKRKDEAVVGWL